MLLPSYYFYHEFSKYEKALRECGAKERHFAPGEYLCCPSYMLSDSYYIISGLTKFSLLTDKAKELVISFFGEGSIFPLITTEQEFTLEPSILHTAITDTRVLAISPEGMREMTRLYPEFSVDAIDHYGRYSNLLLVRNILSTDNDSYQKVCNFLYLYLHNQPDPTDYVPLTQEEIASITGLTRVQIARVIGELKNKGIIDNSRKKICVIDFDELEKCCLSLIRQ